MKEAINNIAIPHDELVQDLSELFQIFSDPTRIKILFFLKEGPLCVADITKCIGASQSAISHQLRILKRTRLVKSKRQGKRVFYELSDNHVHTLLQQGIDHVKE